VKLRLVRAPQRCLFNPAIKLLFRLGVVPPGYALLETVGRRSGLPRRTPVGDGLIGDTFWIVAEHVLSAAYVRNLRADPRVRVRRGRRTVWRRGIAWVLPDDDRRERQRQLALTSLNRRLDAFVVRAAGTELATVRIDPDASCVSTRVPQTIATDDPGAVRTRARNTPAFVGHPQARLRVVGRLAARPRQERTPRLSRLPESREAKCGRAMHNIRRLFRARLTRSACAIPRLAAGSATRRSAPVSASTPLSASRRGRAPLARSSTQARSARSDQTSA
jgi:deazaflavin-dependent oxidoreductase (nitroreductase family)